MNSMATMENNGVFLSMKQKATMDTYGDILGESSERKKNIIMYFKRPKRHMTLSERCITKLVKLSTG